MTNSLLPMGDWSAHEWQQQSSTTHAHNTPMKYLLLPHPTSTLTCLDKGPWEHEIDTHKKAISRHWHMWACVNMLSGYWNIWFPDTQEVGDINERAEAMHRKKRGGGEGGWPGWGWEVLQAALLIESHNQSMSLSSWLSSVEYHWSWVEDFIPDFNEKWIQCTQGYSLAC